MVSVGVFGHKSHISNSTCWCAIARSCRPLPPLCIFLAFYKMTHAGWNRKPIVNLPICFVRADNENHWKSWESQFGEEHYSSSPVFIFYLWLTVSLLTTCFCTLLCHCYYLFSIINVHQDLKQWSINYNNENGQKSILAHKLPWDLEKCCWKCNVNGRACILERLDQTHMLELW